MSGYAARTAPSAGVHDPLTVRAVVVQRTALVTVDVVGLHEDTCAQVRAVCRPWADHVLVHATHTHSGPVSMPGRLGAGLVESWLPAVVEACRDAVAEASSRQQEVTVLTGYGPDPGVASNRRRPGGPEDPALPVLQLVRADGSALATLVSYACHPVVLGPDNHQLSADYPGGVRRLLEQHGGGTVLFATGCAGDQNTGHAVDGGRPYDPTDRTFARCAQVAGLIAAAAQKAELRSGTGDVAAASTAVELDLDLPTATELRHGRARWQGRVTAVRWGPAVLLTLPGEPFCQAGLELRAHIQGAAAVFVLGYTDGCPGYLPTAAEYPFGGYEVCDAHRYYGMPGPFAPGSLERLVEEVRRLSAAVEAADDALTGPPREQ